MEFNPDISQTYLLLVAGVGVLLFLGMRQVKRLAQNSIRQLNRFQELTRLLPALEGLMWLMFVLTAIPMVFRDRISASAGILMILLMAVGWISWFFIRDFTAGIMLRLAHAFEVGNRIKVQNFEGILQRIGHFSITLECENGQNTVIPFSTISNTTLTKIDAGASLKSQTFRLDTAPQSSPQQTLETIRQLALTAPWTSIAYPPKVKFITENQQLITYEVTVFAVEEIYFPTIKNYLENHLTSKNSS